MRFMPDVAALVALAARATDIADLAELSAFYADEVLIADAIWPEDDAPVGFAGNTYLDRFRQRLLDAGKFDDAEIATIVRHARAYAGGIASGQARRKESDPLPDLLAAREGYMQQPVFVDVASFTLKMSDDALLTPWMQITPKAGSSFEHPRYGSVTFDTKTAQDMVANFKGQAYQAHIPIDAEHDTKLSGALGYYRDLRVRPDGAVEARIELTDRGRTLRQSGAFKYFSPEFFRSWKDPGSGKEYTNLLVGGAFTTRPFFKDQHLAPLAASEQYSVITKGRLTVERWQKDEDGDLILDADGNPQLTQEAIDADAAAAASQAAAVEASERAAVVAFREAHGLDENGQPREATKPSAFAETFPDEARRMSELAAANAALVRDGQRRAFKEVALGRDGEGDGSPAFIGDTEKHVNHMLSMAEKYGADSEELRWYIAQNREHATQLAAAGMFTERGSSANAEPATSGEAKAEKMARDVVKANPGMAFAEALDTVLRDNPELYNED